MMRLAIVAAGALPTAPALAAAYFFDGKTYAPGIDSEGGTVDIGVCLAPSMTAAQEAASERALRNAIARWNRREPTTVNLRSGLIPNGSIDFESVAMHELGHCLGLAHPNLGGQVAGDARNATQADPGPNARFDANAGPDGIYGTEDDARSDDENLFHFRAVGANPFSIDERVDGSTWTTDLARLPANATFPANPEREVGPLYGAPFTEAVMQHDIFVGELARSLSHDDVVGIRLGMAGFDAQQGTADDYVPQLVYRGRNQSNCKITVEYDAAKTGLAQCSASASVRSGPPAEYVLSSGTVTFNPTINWNYSGAPPCTASLAMSAGEWQPFSSPCTLGISAPDTVRAQLADDLGVDGFGTRWTIYAYDYAEPGQAGGYVQLGLDDALASGKGYWLITLDDDRTVDVQGDYAAALDAPLRTNADSGNGWNLLGFGSRYPAPFSDTRIIAEDGSALPLSAADPATGAGNGSRGSTACSDGSPDANCLAARFAYVWQPSLGSYRELDDTDGNLEPFDAVWLFAGREGIEARLPIPDSERTTP